MDPLRILGPVVSKVDIQEYVTNFSTLGKQPGQGDRLSLVADGKITDIDSSLFAYAVLFCQQRRGLVQDFDFPKNDPDKDDRLIWQIRQFWLYGYLLTGQNVFRARFGKRMIAGNIQRRSEYFRRSLGFIASRSFIPPILISQREGNDFYQLFFRENVSRFIGENLAGWPKTDSHGGLTHAFEELERGKLTRSNIIRHLACQFFANSLEQAKIYEAYLYRYNAEATEIPLVESDVKMGRLTVRRHIDYFEAVSPIFDDLIQRPIVYQYVFSLLVSSELSIDPQTQRSDLTEKNKERYASRLQNLWGFTVDAMHGVHELVKNVLEHSSTKLGLLTARVHRPKQSAGLTDAPERDLFSELSHYFANESPESLIELNVIDIGNTGVIDTLRENLSVQAADSQLNSDLRAVIKSDLKLIDNSAITLQNLLDPSLDVQLHHQAKRSLAHFGFLTLSKLIGKHRGLLAASSARSTSREKAKVGDFAENFFADASIGTAVSIYLPVRSGSGYQPDPVHKLRLPREVSAIELQGMEDLLNCVFLDKDEHPMPDLTGPVMPICQMTPNLSEPGTRQTEQMLWKSVNDRILRLEQHIPSSSRPLIVLDLQHLDLDPSQLFRLLGSYGANFGHLPLALTNFDVSLYRQLLELNDTYNEVILGADYWTANEVIVAFPSIKTRGIPFFFAELLWGTTKTEFIRANLAVARTHFNAVSAYAGIEVVSPNEESQQGEETALDLSFSPLFLSGNVLLPIDVVLKSGALTIFEHNARVLLNNEL